jgi:hypothetical protein
MTQRVRPSSIEVGLYGSRTAGRQTDEFASGRAAQGGDQIQQQSRVERPNARVQVDAGRQLRG